MAQAPVSLLILIRSFDTGGAQRQLIALLRGIDKRRLKITVAAMYGGGAMAAEMQAVPGVRCISLEREASWDLLPFLARLRRTVNALDPQLLYGYLGPARLATLFAGRGRRKIIWGVRDSNMDLSRYGWIARAAARAERLFAGWPDLVLANSVAGRDYRVAHGFPPHKVAVIENGIDLARFRADPAGRLRLRSAWGVPPGALLVGVTGRLDPMKGYPDFLAAAALLAGVRPELRFVCIGEGPRRYRDELEACARRLGVDRVLTWAPEQADMAAAYSALDIAVSSSAFGEGFSNVVAEAMACGVPCVVTDVGDSARIVGGAGEVVAPRDPRALADGVLRMLARFAHGDYADAARRAAAGRERVRENFSLERMVERTQSALLELAAA
jgi:glycosyltransferase involved in cell wall biosynthesis